MRMKPAPFLVAGLLATAISCGAAHASDRALVVGVNSYPFLTENGTPTNRDLQVAVQDAQHFDTLLTSVWKMDPANVRLLTDADATRENILASFDDWLVDGSGPGDRVVFYFSGHGFQSVDESGDETDDPFDEGLAPHNTSGDLADGQLDNIVIDDEIGALIDRLEGREVWVVVDACFSGTITRSAAVSADGRSATARARTLTPLGPVRQSTRSIVSGESDLRRHKVNSRLIDVVADTATAPDANGSLFAFTATTSAQLAFETSDGGGVFTAALVDGLTNKTADFDGDGQVTAAELLTFVRKRSDEFCESEPMCRDGAGLTPELETARENFTHVLAPPLFAELNTVVVAEAEPEPEPEATEETQTTEPAPTETADAGAEATEETETAVEVTVVEAEPVPADTAAGLFSHENDFPIDLAIEHGNELRFGQEVIIKVASDETGYLVLFDQGPDGALRQIFPNEYSVAHAKDGLIHGGGVIAVPDPSYGFAFEANEYGESVLIALVIDDHVDFGGLLGEHPDFNIISDPSDFLSHIAQLLLAPEVTEDPNQPNGRHHWAFATLHYTVE